jgi:hypothetical protein
MPKSRRRFPARKQRSKNGQGRPMQIVEFFERIVLSADASRGMNGAVVALDLR